MRRLLTSFLRFPRAEGRLLLRSLFVVAGFRLALWTLPARRVLAAEPRARRGAPLPTRTAERVARMVRVSARRVPGASCLTRALAARWLMAEAGLPSALRFGHSREPDGTFTAHAWLEHQGRVLIGGEDSPTAYHPFSAGRAPLIAASPERP